MEIYCDECGAQWRNHCVCPVSDDVAAVLHLLDNPPETWRGVDGHKYVGDPKRASSADHAEDCGCPGSVNFDPESWY